jgi:hypothetical protein
MKHIRRKELKTNELSAYLQQMRETVTRNSNYIIGGLVVVVLVLMAGLYVKRNRAEAETNRWREYQEIQKAASEGKGDVVDRAAGLVLAAQKAGDAKLGPQALSLYAGLLYDKALSTAAKPASAEREQLLEKAKTNYQELIKTYANRPEVIQAARMSLAAVAETLCVDGKQAELDVAKEQYKEVLKNPNSPYAPDARQKLDTLAERTAKLQIVATRPAEPAPAPATKPATKPATAPVVAPAPVRAPTTAPASAPKKP